MFPLHDDDDCSELLLFWGLTRRCSVATLTKIMMVGMMIPVANNDERT